nr:MAG TPA_asm: Protein of unknown function (DUF1289) [Caudoviricetes sp.]
MDYICLFRMPFLIPLLLSFLCLNYTPCVDVCQR